MPVPATSARRCTCSHSLVPARSAAAPTWPASSIAASRRPPPSSTCRRSASGPSPPRPTVPASAAPPRSPTSPPTTSRSRGRSAATEGLEPGAVVREAASLAASPILRNQGTVGGNLCQHTRCWYYRGLEWNCWLGGGDTCYAQIGEHRKHNLQPGDCISAHPSDLAPALLACRATVHLQSAHGERELHLADLYRRPTEQNRSLIDLDVGEIVTAVELETPPDASVYLRLGERRAFSFPLVSIAVARFRGDVVVA